MPIFNQLGSHVVPINPYLKSNGSWKIAKSAWVKESGTWRNAYTFDGLDEAFSLSPNYGFNDTVSEILIQPDGKVLVSGLFTSFNNASRNRLIRFNADGTEDTAFYANLGTGFSGSVTTLAIQSDGKILAGGAFTNINGVTKNRLVRLNSDGTTDVDFSFQNFNNSVTAIAIQSDGKILVGGLFTAIFGATRNRFVRLNADGTEDTAFSTNLGTGFSGTVNTIAIQSDGKILAGGLFAGVNGVTKNRLVRLNSDGTEDTAFYANLGTGFNDSVTTLAIQSDGKILVGGAFTTLNGITRNRIVRLNSNGTQDEAFYSNLGSAFNGNVNRIAIQSDGKIIIGGSFNQLNGVVRNRIVRLESTGSQDTSFYNNLNPGFNNQIGALGLQSDGKILVGGSFTDFSNLRFSSINSNGQRSIINLSPSIRVRNLNNFVFSVKLQSDQKVLVAGPFTLLNQMTRNCLIRLNPDGSEDTAFYANLGSAFNASVRSTAIQPDGKILVGGNFTTFNGATRNRLVRLNPDGTEDASFYTNLGSGFNGEVQSMTVQADGKILVGGSFTNLNGASRGSLVRLNANGTEDTAFYSALSAPGSGFNGFVQTVLVHPNGKIWVGGSFTTLGGESAQRLLALNADGSRDYGFSGPTFNGTVGTLVIQPDQKVLVAGQFTTANLITRNRLVRLNANGAEDTAFYSNLGTAFNNVVQSVAVQQNGQIVVAGGFTAFNGAARNSLVRLNADGSQDSVFYSRIGSGLNVGVNSLELSPEEKLFMGCSIGIYNNRSGARAASTGVLSLIPLPYWPT
jgi:uncharacterized delta-60 repeat protein